MEFDEPLRDLILDRLRREERTSDLFSIVDPDQYIEKMTDGDWDAFLAKLETEKQWERIWRLAPAAPVSWCAKFLNTLYDASWRPPESADPGLYALARVCCNEPIKHLEGLARGQAILEGHEGGITCLSVNNNGRILASGSTDSTIRLWSLPEGDLLHTLKGRWNGITCIAMSPNGDRLAAWGGDKTIRVWSLPDGALLHKHEFAKYNRDAACLAMSPDGKRFAAGIGKDISIWSVEEGELLHTLDGDSHWGVLCLAFSPDNKMLASGGWDKNIRLWDIPEGNLQETLEHHDKEVAGLAVAGNGQILASKSRDGIIKFFSLSGKELMGTLKVPDYADRSECIVLNPDGSILSCACLKEFSGVRSGAVELWDTADSTLINVLEGHKGKVNCLAASADGQILASGGEDKTIRIWEFGRIDIGNLSTKQISPSDTQFVKNLLKSRYLPSAKRQWLEFLLKFSAWYHNSEKRD